jgi:hypothetical protein
MPVAASAVPPPPISHCFFSVNVGLLNFVLCYHGFICCTVTLLSLNCTVEYTALVYHTVCSVQWSKSLSFSNTLYKDNLPCLQEAVHRNPHLLRYENWLLHNDSTATVSFSTGVCDQDLHRCIHSPSSHPTWSLLIITHSQKLNHRLQSAEEFERGCTSGT